MSKTTLASSPQGVRCYSHPILKDFQVSDWSRQVTWPKYWLLIGRDATRNSAALNIICYICQPKKYFRKKWWCFRILSVFWINTCIFARQNRRQSNNNVLFMLPVNSKFFLPLYVGEFWGRYCNKLPFLTFEQSSLDQALKEQGFMSV